MAGKIKDITIEFDGNTTKLSNALKNVETKSRDTTKSLRKIEKSLKFNPGNAELVAQQQKKLKEAIENTKEKLNILKEADKQAKEQLANGKLGQDAYDELQREIIKTENNLDSYSKKLKSSKDEQTKLKENTSLLKEKMKETGTTTYDLSKVMGDDFVKSLKKGEGSSKDVEKAIEELSKSTQKGKDSAEEMGKSFVNLNAITNVFGKIKDGAINAFNAISDAWKEVDESLDTITKKTGASGKTMDDLKQQYKDVYSSMAVDSKKVGDAIGEVNTQFALQGDSLEEATKYILKYSEINDSDVTTSTQNAKKAMDQFNLSSKDLSSVLDIVTKVGQDTGVSVDTLFNKVTDGAPTLQNLGLKFNESVVLMGKFEKSGIDSSKALSFMTKAQAVAAKDGKSLTTVLSEFSQKAKTSTDQTKLLNESNKLFGTKGGALMLKALKEGKLNFEDLAKSAESAKGTVSSTYENILDPADKFTVAQNNIKLAMADVGDTIQQSLAPALEFIAGIIQKVVKWFTGLDGTTKSVIVTITGLVVAITSIITIIGVISGAMTALTPILAGVSGAFAAVGTSLSSLFTFVAANPIVLIIGAIVAAIYLIIKNWEKVKEVTINIWNTIVAFLQPIIDNIGNFITTSFNAIKEFFIGLWDKIKLVFETVWNAISGVVTTTINIISTTISTIWEAIKATTETIWNTIKEVISTVWEGIKTTTSNIWEGIKTAVSGAINFVQKIISDVWDGISKTTSNVWNGIKNTISDVVKGIKNTVFGVFNSIRDKITGIWDGIISFFENIHIPLPHFSFSGSLNPFSKNFPPKIGIDWYAQGGIFDSPRIIGVGEAGSEAVVPTHKLDKFFDDALKRVGAYKNNNDNSNERNIIINISKMEVRDDNDIEKIARKLDELIRRNKRRFA